MNELKQAMEVLEKQLQQLSLATWDSSRTEILASFEAVQFALESIQDELENLAKDRR